MDRRYMTHNNIFSKCPMCPSESADVVAIVTINNVNKVIVKCQGEIIHQYPLDLNGKNQEWKKFFKPEFLESIKKQVRK